MYFRLVLSFVILAVIDCQSSCIIDHDSNLDIERYKDCCNASVGSAYYFKNEYFNPIKCYINIQKLLFVRRSNSIDFTNNYDRIYINSLKVPIESIIYNPELFKNATLFKIKPNFIISTNKEVDQELINNIQHEIGLKVKGFYFPNVTEINLVSYIDFYIIKDSIVFANDRKFAISDDEMGIYFI